MTPLTAVLGTSKFVSDRSGANDEIHIVIVDEDGGITGVLGQILESFSKLSKAADAKTPQGDTNYLPTVIRNQSKHVYWVDWPTASGTNWGSNATGVTFTAVDILTLKIIIWWWQMVQRLQTDNFKQHTRSSKTAETVDVGLIIGKGSGGGTTHVDNLITIAENRKDCVVFASPQRADVVNVTNSNTQANNVIDFFDNIRSSSYVVFDSGYKQMYDRFNDVLDLCL